MNIKQYIENLSQKATNFIHVAVRKTRRVIWKSAVAGVIAVGIAGGSVAYAVSVVTPHVHAIYSAAKLVDGEARGESPRGQKAVFATILERIEDKRFPSSMHAVIYQPYSRNNKILQYNAMGDHLHENLSTDLGQTILMRTAWWYTQYQLGIFHAPLQAEGAHSYCVPVACEKQKGYFGTLKQIGTIGNHVFYGDCDCKGAIIVAEEKTNTAPATSIRPKVRPSQTAPKTSIRPKVRPTKSVSQTEQVGKQIDEILHEVLAKN